MRRVGRIGARHLVLGGTWASAVGENGAPTQVSAVLLSPLDHGIE
jgi:hypothetical protein